MKKKTIKTAASLGSGSVGLGGGTAGSVALISSSGSVVGLSGPGIMSGLAAIGGSAIGGIVVLTCSTTMIAVAAGYYGYRIAKKYCKK